MIKQEITKTICKCSLPIVLITTSAKTSGADAEWLVMDRTALVTLVFTVDSCGGFGWDAHIHYDGQHFKADTISLNMYLSNDEDIEKQLLLICPEGCALFWMLPRAKDYEAKLQPENSIGDGFFQFDHQPIRYTIVDMTQ